MSDRRRFAPKGRLLLCLAVACIGSSWASAADLAIDRSDGAVRNRDQAIRNTSFDLRQPPLELDVPDHLQGPAMERPTGHAPGVAVRSYDDPLCDAGRSINARIAVKRPDSFKQYPVSWARVEAVIAPFSPEELQGGSDPLANTVIGTAFTNQTGEVRFCDVPEDAVGRDVFVRVHAENDHWSVRSDGEVLVWSCEACSKAKIGALGADLGEQVIQHPTSPVPVGLFIHHALRPAFLWVTTGEKECWDPKGVYCEPISFELAEGVGPDRAWGAETADVSTLRSGRNVGVLYYVVADVLEHRMWSSGTDTCVTDPSSEECAWRKGFAIWVSMMIRRTPTFVGEDLEAPTWGSKPGMETGHGSAERVAGGLFDLTDGWKHGTLGNERPWDRRSEHIDEHGRWGRDRLWNVARSQSFDDARQFLDAYIDRFLKDQFVPELTVFGDYKRSLEREVRATFFQNTLHDGTFRDSIVWSEDNARPHPFAEHVVEFPHANPYWQSTAWTVVAARLGDPAPTSAMSTGYRLTLRDPSEGAPLAKSKGLTNEAQYTFIALNHAVAATPVGGWWEAVMSDSDSIGNPPATADIRAYEITRHESVLIATNELGDDEEDALGAKVMIEPGLRSFSMESQSSDFVRIIGLAGLQANVQASIKARPDENVDIALYLVDAAAPFATELSAIAASDQFGAGGAETVKFTPETDSVTVSASTPLYALVIVAKGKPGSSTNAGTNVFLAVDQTPPTADIAFNYGPSVCGAFPYGMQVSGTDSETHVEAATWWVEPLEPPDTLKVFHPINADGQPNQCATYTPGGDVIWGPCANGMLQAPLPVYAPSGKLTMGAQTMNHAGMVSAPVYATATYAPYCDAIGFGAGIPLLP